MKLISFRVQGEESFGIVSATGVVDAGRRLGAAAPDLRSALAAPILEQVKAMATLAADYGLDEVELLPVIPNPSKIFCIGLNYLTHLKETGRELPAHPVIFTRFASSQTGAGAPIIRPRESEQLDFEGEMAVIIGRRGRRIAKHEALSFVAGYACYNDASVRDWQRHSSQFTAGKNFENTGAFGPWMVTADEIADPSALSLVTRLNGELMQSAPTCDLMFDVPALIAYISTFSTLEPGDVIVTGTTGGVGAFRQPPVWMKAGDVVEVEISGIGVLRNPVADEALP